MSACGNERLLLCAAPALTAYLAGPNLRTHPLDSPRGKERSISENLRLVPPVSADQPASELRTFLFADVRSYTRFTAERGDEVAARLAAKFASVARQEVGARGGEVIELRGDEALAVFSSARQALRAAIALQETFARESEADPELPLTVGIGLDAGEAVPVEGGYRGGALNLGARLCSLAAAGEVLVSEGVVHLAGKVEGLKYTERGAVQLKGFADSITVMHVTAAQAPAAKASDAVPADEAVQRLPFGGFLGSLPAGSLVGREEELRHIMPPVDEVAAGEGRLLLLAGEPGVGKTRLAQEVTLVAHNYGFLVVVGRCYEQQQSVPFYPFREALAMLHAVAPAAVRSQASQRWPYLGRLLPDELGHEAATSSESSEEQERLFRAVSGFISAIAELRPIALLLDDLHWADTASLQLLQHLARHTRGSSVLIVGTYRDVEVGADHPLQPVLRDLGREQLVNRVPIKRLRQDETRVLIAETLGEMEMSEDFAALVYRQTDGNPFFTQQVLQALVEAGSVFREHGEWHRLSTQEIELPESVRSVITQRVSRLSPETQEVLQEASVLGPLFTFDDLLQLTTLTGSDTGLEDKLDAALTEAAGAKIVRTARRDEYAFDHALTQQTLYAELSPRRRRRLHLAAGEAIEHLPERRRQSRAGELAWHFLQGDDADRALQYAMLAGDQAETVFAHEEAERHFRTALELISEAEPGQDDRALLEATIREKLGTVQRLRGQYREAQASLEEAGRAYRTAGESEAEGRVAAQLGLIDAVSGQAERGINRLQPLARALEERVPSETLARLYSVLLRLFNITARWADFETTSQALLQLAKVLGDQRLLAEAELHRGNSLVRNGEYDEALSALEAAIAGSGSVGDLSTQCAGLNFAAVLYHSQHNFDRALTYRVRAVEVAERLGDPFEISYRAVEAAYGTFLLGDWKKSRHFAERALSAALLLDALRLFLQPLYTLGELSMYEGEWEEATRYLDEALVVARHLGADTVIREVEGLRSERDILQGEFEAALARLEPLLKTPGWEEHLNFLLPLAWARLEMGDADGASSAADKAAAEAARQKSPVGQIETLRMQGIIASRQSRWNDAEHCFSQALRRSKEISYPWGEARALYGLGLMHARKGDDAGECLTRSAALFRSLGARTYQARVAEALLQFAPRSAGPG
jgi:class 3 adenylate cyclase/tetratricopeptide (TPR) repeat protein